MHACLDLELHCEKRVANTLARMSYVGGAEQLSCVFECLRGYGYILTRPFLDLDVTDGGAGWLLS